LELGMCISSNMTYKYINMLKWHHIYGIIVINYLVCCLCFSNWNFILVLSLVAWLHPLRKYIYCSLLIFVIKLLLFCKYLIKSGLLVVLNKKFTLRHGLTLKKVRNDILKNENRSSEQLHQCSICDPTN